jgi:hypothetical protein
MPLPDNMIDRYATERCLLLTWSDLNNQYKLQMRPYVPGESTDGPGKEQQNWVDAKDKERVNLNNRSMYQVYLVMCEHVRLQYRLVSERGAAPVDGKYVANWASAASEPVASYVDPPIEVNGELCFESDVLPPSVTLSWTSSNMDWLRKTMGDNSQGLAGGDHGPFASWPSMMAVKVQVRWRVVRTLSGMDALPPVLTQGKFFTSPAVDNIMRGGAIFDARTDTWRMSYRDIVHGVVARFCIRVGTNYRWSPWSEESDDVEVEIPEPMPSGMLPLPKDVDGDQDRNMERTCVSVEISKLSDSEVDISWAPFNASGALTSLEYRVVVCPLEHQDEPPPFNTRGIVLTTIIPSRPQDHVVHRVQHLHPNTCYVLRIDARYPYVGKRAFSNCKALSPCFRTPYPLRPPLPPLCTIADDHDEIVVNPLASSDEEAGQDLLFWQTTPWIALRVERRYLTDYSIEFKPVFWGGRETGGEYFKDWQAPAKVEIVEKDSPSDVDVDASDTHQWCIVRIAFGDSVPEVVICRLVHKKPLKSISQLQWTVSTPPLVPHIAPAAFAGPVLWARVSDNTIKLAVRFFLTSRRHCTRRVFGTSGEFCSRAPQVRGKVWTSLCERLPGSLSIDEG